MRRYNLGELRRNYELDIDGILHVVQGKKLVVLQFADGLKPYALSIVDYLKSKSSGVDFMIYLGSCFGACDVPLGLDILGVDLIIQIGHNSLQPTYLR